MLVPSHHNSGRGGSLNVLTGTGTACWLQRRKKVGCWGTPLPVDFGTRRRMTQRSRQALLAIPRPPSRVWERSYIRHCSGLIGGEDIHRIVAGIAQPNEASNALHEKFGFKRAGTFTGGAGNSTNIGTCCGWRGRSFCDLISCASDDKDDSKPQKTFG